MGTADSYDDYDQWFQKKLPGYDPQATGKPLMDWNSWRGSPYIYETKEHPTEWVAKEAKKYLQKYNQMNTSQPFFLKISFHRPHSPYDPPQHAVNYVLNHYNLSHIQHILRSNEWGDERYAQNEWCSEENKDAWCGLMNVSETNNSRVMYFAQVKFIDDKVGEILDLLKEYGLYNDSYILWTADHGDQLGDHNLWRKTYPYNSNAKVPMIVKWPQNGFNDEVKVKRGTVDNWNIVELRDLLPTFHSVAGIRSPANWSTEWSGLDMNCIISKEDCEWREYLDLEHSTCYNETNHWNALTDGLTYKYVFNAFFGNESLFDIVNDYDEMHDLAPLATTNTTIENVLVTWRKRMVDMFEKQGRGSNWVQNGTLMQRTNRQTYGVNFPNNAAPCQ